MLQVTVQPALQIDTVERFQFDKLLTIDLIRQHTKTDDIPSVTDEQLALYRDAAVESAEQYTGFMLAGQKSITEPIEFKITTRVLMRGYTDYTLKYPTIDGIVDLYGSLTQQVRIRKGTKRIQIPIMAAYLDVSSACCRSPCDSEPGGWVQLDLAALYRTGFARVEDIPKGIVLGMLKYIAWNVTHPGDEIVSIRNKEQVTAGLMAGTNNVAWASGALELWRQYDLGAI